MNSSEIDAEKETEFFIDYEKWRRLINKVNCLCMLVVLITEIIMFFIFKSEDLFLQPIPVYLFRFLILPTLISLMLLLGGQLLARRFAGNELWLNAIPVLQLTLLCFMVSCVHHVFAVTFCTFSFPIFLSAIFSDRRLTHAVTGLSFVLLTMAQFIGPGFNDVYSQYLVPQYFVALIALLASFLICTILMRFQDEKNGVIKAVYQSRLEAIHQLNLDQKTGLYGVTAFYNRLERLLYEQPSQHAPAVAMFDIDDFKRVNDTFGHAKGDEVILRMSQLMKEVCGDRFFPVRFGGEEFIILFFDGELQEYRKAANDLLLEFAAAEYDFTHTTITISAGISQWTEGCTGEELFMQADKALYVSKASGKNRITVYDEDTHKDLLM